MFPKLHAGWGPWDRPVPSQLAARDLPQPTAAHPRVTIAGYRGWGPNHPARAGRSVCAPLPPCSGLCSCRCPCPRCGPRQSAASVPCGAGGDPQLHPPAGKEGRKGVSGGASSTPIMGRGTMPPPPFPVAHRVPVLVPGDGGDGGAGDVAMQLQGLAGHHRHVLPATAHHLRGAWGEVRAVTRHGGIWLPRFSPDNTRTRCSGFALLPVPTTPTARPIWGASRMGQEPPSLWPYRAPPAWS